MTMICEVNLSLLEKIVAIQQRTPDQKMNRDGVPVAIGGKVFEVRPMTRKTARQFSGTQARFSAELELAEKQAAELGERDPAAAWELALAMEAKSDELQNELIALVIPELAGQAEWLDEQATSAELTEALTLATAFLAPDPNLMRAQTATPSPASTPPPSTPSSPSSTPPTPLTRLAISPMSRSTS